MSWTVWQGCPTEAPYQIMFLFALGFRTYLVRFKYEVKSKIFRTGASIYTTAVVARSTGHNRRNCEFLVLLRSFAATAWKRAKMSPRTLARTELAASPWQRTVSHFRPHPAVSGEIRNGCQPPPTVLPWSGTLWHLPVSKNEIEADLIPLRRSRPKCRVLNTLT
jgi:hypothetical protein